MASQTTTAAVRPVWSPVVRDIACEPLTTESLARWRASEACADEVAYFAAYPEQSLLSTVSRAFIYHCVRSQKPDRVIEVGTYHAGTAELIARALHENGRGRLFTADPFGAVRCPAIISTWPDELRERVEFFPLNSMAFYLELERRKLSIDIAFIDGNHAYEFALFDTLMAAKSLSRGGTIIVDNAEQAGPYFAAAMFLENNPGWQTIGGNHPRPAALADPLDSTFNRASLDDASLLILKAPDAYTVTSTPFDTSERPIQAAALSGIRLASDRATGADPVGALFWEAIYRMFPVGVFPIEIKRRGRVDAPTGRHLECVFDQPVAETFAGPCTLEVVLLYRTDSQMPYRFDSIEMMCQDGSTRPFFGRQDSRT